MTIANGKHEAALIALSSSAFGIRRRRRVSFP